MADIKTTHFNFSIGRFRRLPEKKLDVDFLKTSLSSFCFKSSSSLEIFSRASWSSFFIFSQFFEFELDEFWLDDWFDESDWMKETVGDWIDFSDKSQSDEDD